MSDLDPDLADLPLLDLPAHAPVEEYLARRAELGADEVNRRMLRATGTGTFLLDTGYLPEPITSPAELAALAGGRARGSADQQRRGGRRPGGEWRVRRPPPVRPGIGRPAT